MGDAEAAFTTKLAGIYFFHNRFHFSKFSPRKLHFRQDPFLFPHMTFQSLGYVMKRAAAFRVCPPRVPLY